MEKTTPNQQYQTLHCKVEGHDNQPLNLVCTDNTCRQQGAICADCMSINHMSHINKCLSLSVFLNRIKKGGSQIKIEKEKGVTDFYQQHDDNLQLIQTARLELNNSLDLLAKAQIDFFTLSNPELENLITDKKDEFIESINDIEKKQIKDIDSTVLFIRSLVNKYSPDTGLPLEKSAQNENNYSQTVQKILRDSDYNIKAIRNYLNTLTHLVQNLPKLRQRQLGQKVSNFSLQGIVKKFDVNEPTAMLIYPNVITTIPKKKQVVTGNKNGEIYVREIQTGKVQAKFKYGSEITGVFYLEKLEQLVVANKEQSLSLWNPDKGNEEKLTQNSKLKDHALSFAYLENKNILLVGDAIGYIHFWDLSTKQLIKSVEIHKKNWVKDMLLLPGNEYLATSGSDNTIRIWKFTEDLKNLEKFKEITKVENAGKLANFDDGLLFYASTNKIGLLNWRVPEVVSTIIHGGGGVVSGLTYIENERVLLTIANGENKLKAWKQDNNWECDSTYDIGHSVCGSVIIEDDGYYIAALGNSKLDVLYCL